MGNQLGEYIQIRREALGLSQRKLAEKAKVSRSAINRVEAGDTVPSTKTLEAIATALDVPLSRLLDAAQGKSQQDKDPLLQKVEQLSGRDKRLLEGILDLMLKE